MTYMMIIWLFEWKKHDFTQMKHKQDPICAPGHKSFDWTTRVRPQRPPARLQWPYIKPKIPIIGSHMAPFYTQ